jgi:hypothetical protein
MEGERMDRPWVERQSLEESFEARQAGWIGLWRLVGMETVVQSRWGLPSRRTCRMLRAKGKKIAKSFERTKVVGRLRRCISAVHETNSVVDQSLVGLWQREGKEERKRSTFNSFDLLRRFMIFESAVFLGLELLGNSQVVPVCLCGLDLFDDILWLVQPCHTFYSDFAAPESSRNVQTRPPRPRRRTTRQTLPFQRKPWESTWWTQSWRPWGSRRSWRPRRRSRWIPQTI